LNAIQKHATPEELRAAGIDPEHPVASSERRRGEPGSWRVGDDLVTRRATDGGIVHHLGYFTPQQVANRRAWAEGLSSALAARPLIFRCVSMTKTEFAALYPERS